MPRKSPLTERIAADIKESGFPLELHVLNVCSAKNCGRMPSVRYEYLGNLREIDLITRLETIRQRSETGNVPPHVATTLIIECKKSTSKPWVFFSSSRYAFKNVACFLKYSSDFDLYFQSQQLVPLLAQIHPRITSSHYIDPSISRCIGYYEAFRKHDNPSEIYKALDSVISYLRYISQIRDSRRATFGVFSEFFLPVIVVEGGLFEAYLNGSNIKVHPKPHVQLRTFYDGDIYVIDIVTKEHFKTFFDEVDQFHKSLVKAISSIEFPPDFVAGSKKKGQEVMNMPDTDGMLTMTIENEESDTGEGKIRLRSNRVPLF